MRLHKACLKRAFRVHRIPPTLMTLRNAPLPGQDGDEYTTDFRLGLDKAERTSRR